MIIHGDKGTVLSVFEKFGNGANIRRDDGLTSRVGFDYRKTEPFKSRGAYVNITEGIYLS